MDRHIYEELVHTIMEAEKSRDLPSAGRRARTAHEGPNSKAREPQSRWVSPALEAGGPGEPQRKSSLSSRPENHGADGVGPTQGSSVLRQRGRAPFLRLFVRLSPQGARGGPRPWGALRLFSRGNPDRCARNQGLTHCSDTPPPSHTESERNHHDPCSLTFTPETLPKITAPGRSLDERPLGVSRPSPAPAEP